MSGENASLDQALRRDDPEAWLISLYAPAKMRPQVQALAAFAHELRGISAKVTQPLAGEIRLQWWRDVLAMPESSDAAMPLAAALLQARMQARLPVSALQAMIDAYAHDLYGEPFADWAALEAYCGATDAAMLRLTTLVLAQGNDPGGADVCGHAGMASGLLRIAERFGMAALQHIDQPLQQAMAHLKEAEAGLGTLAPEARAGFVGLGLVKARLKRWQRHQPAPLSPLSRLTRLWFYAQNLGRV